MRILHPIPIFDLPLPTTTIQKHPRERLPSQRSAGTGTLIPRDRFREVERRNTIAGIALPSPPPRGTIRGGGGGRWRSVYRDKDRISGCDGTAGPDSLSSPANVRQSRGWIEDKRKKHVSSSPPIRGPRRRSTSTTTTTTTGTTETGMGVQTDDYEGNIRNTFAGPLLLLESPPPSGGERVAGSTWLSELRIFSLRADREWNGCFLIPLSSAPSFVQDS